MKTLLLKDSITLRTNKRVSVFEAYLTIHIVTSRSGNNAAILRLVITLMLVAYAEQVRGCCRDHEFLSVPVMRMLGIVWRAEERRHLVCVMCLRATHLLD